MKPDEYFQYHLSEQMELAYSRARQKRAVQWIVRGNHQKILEVGIGIVSLPEIMAENGIRGITLLSVESNSHFVLNQSKKIMNQDLNATVINKKIEEVTTHDLARFLGGPPDLIVLNSILHELEDSDSVLRVLMDLANEKTQLFVNVPNAQSYHNLSRELFGNGKRQRLILSKNVRHREFTKDRLLSNLENFGLYPIYCYTFGYKPVDFYNLELLIEAGKEFLPTLEEMVSFSFHTLPVGAEIEGVFARKNYSK